MTANYQAYLLRLERGQHQIHWRAVLENAHTGEVLRFATERELIRHLLQTLSDNPLSSLPGSTNEDTT